MMEKWTLVLLTEFISQTDWLHLKLRYCNVCVPSTMSCLAYQMTFSQVLMQMNMQVQYWYMIRHKLPTIEFTILSKKVNSHPGSTTLYPQYLRTKYIKSKVKKWKGSIDFNYVHVRLGQVYSHSLCMLTWNGFQYLAATSNTKINSFARRGHITVIGHQIWDLILAC